MKRIIKTVFAVTLSLIMVFSTFGAESEYIVQMFKAFNVEASAASSGTFGADGNNLTWTLDSVGTLTISGTGEMENVNFTSVPWYSSKSSVKSVVVEEGVTSLGDYAFYNCSNLTSVSLPESLVKLGQNVFYYCNNMTAVSLPANLSSIGSGTFNFCTSLSEITVDSNNQYFCISDGVLYSKDMKTIVCCPAAKTDTSFSIPGTVTSIGNSAFHSCSTLTEIQIPDSVTSLGNYAFCNCSNLNSLNIPAGVTSLGNFTFSGCTSLASVNIPDSVTNIGDSLFDRCSSISAITLPDGITYIGSDAFHGCTNLSSVNIPDSVTVIGSSAFYSCISLESITLPNSLTSIGDSAFHGCKKITSINIPSSITSIGQGPLGECDNLATIAVDGGNEYFRSINNVLYSKDYSRLIAYAPKKPDVIYSVFDGVTAIDEYAFSGCTNLTSVTLPDGVNTYGSYVFSNCTNLESINIPVGVKALPLDMFLNCKSLKSITIPEGVESINSSAFSGCSALETVSLPSTLKTIGNSSFSNCSSLNNITIPESVTSFGTSSFLGCSSLESFNIPAGVKSIPQKMLMGCSNLKILSIPKSVTAIYKQGLAGCDKLKDIYYGGNVSNWAKISIDKSNNAHDFLFVAKDYSYYDSTLTNTWIHYTKDYKIVYYLDGAEYADNAFNAGETIGNIPAVGDKFGYTFSGWKDLPEIMPASDLNVYGTYDADIYTVTFDADGGKFADGSSKIEVKTAFGSKISSISDVPTKNLYEFTGWSEIPETMPAEDITITAQYLLIHVHDYTGTVTKAATCTESGVMTYTCSCGDSYLSSIPPTGHTLKSAVKENVISATCTKSGSYDSVVYCSVCGKRISSETVTVTATGHNYISSVTPATCTSAGYTTYTCSACGDSYVSDITDVIAHSYIKTIKVPTCTSEGYTMYVCSECGNTTADSFVPAVGHKYSSVITSATCTSAGYTTYTCSVCGDSYVSDMVDVIPHTYTKSVTSPTCTEGGYTVYTCSVCGTTTTGDLTPAKGHRYVVIDENDTTVTYKCSVCGDTYTADKGSETHNYKVSSTTATCTSDGITTYVCTICGITYIENTKATGHNYNSRTVDATCTEAGFVTYTCSKCGDTYSETIPAIGHNYKTVTVEATCTADGSVTTTCSNCGDSSSEIIPATGHNYDVKVNYATCYAVGTATYTCLNCGYTYSRSIAKLSHVASSPVSENRTEPTCTAEGRYDEVIYCTLCNAELSRTSKSIPAIGHTDPDVYGKCARCGETISTEAFNLWRARSAVISVPGGKTINWKYRARMTASADLPSGYHIAWFEGNNLVSGSSDYTTGGLTSGHTYTAKVVDSNGNVISTDSQSRSVTVNVKTGIFDKIVSFFTRIFSSNIVVNL